MQHSEKNTASGDSQGDQARHGSDILRHVNIEDYLRNRLSESAAAEFEILMLEDDELFEEVQTARALHREMGQHRPAFSARQGWLSTSASLSQWFRQPLSIAASVLLFAMILLTNYSMQNAGQPEVSGDALTVNSVALLDTLRGADNLIEITGRPPYLLQIDVDLIAADNYTLTLTETASGMTVVRDNASGTGTRDGWLRWLVNRELSGPYTLDLQWQSRDESAARNYQLLFMEPGASEQP